jgi:lon-related putative ATP-dependent protease
MLLAGADYRKELQRSMARLDTENLYSVCDPNSFDFKTTADIADGPEIIGQPRAVEAITFGVELRGDGYNIFALGPEGIGKRFLVEHYLKSAALGRPKPPDVCYVNNLTDPNKPRLLTLPAGLATGLRGDIQRLIEDIAVALPRAFESEEYQSRLHDLEEAFQARPAKHFEDLRGKAKAQGIAMLQTPMGFAFAPLKNEEVIPVEEFQKLAAEERERITKTIDELQDEMQKIFRQLGRWQKELREKLRELNRETASFTIDHMIDETAARYRDHVTVRTYLGEIRKDIAEHAKEFLQLHEGQPSRPGLPPSVSDSAAVRRYGINVLVDNGGLAGAPVLYEDHPTFENLIGRIEHIAHMGTLITDFNLIRAGALHRANGGFLVLDARKVLQMSFAWEALKRALQARQLRIESVGQALSLVTTVSLEPEPLPLSVKVILIGDPELYYLLCRFDPEFSGLFKVSADFDDQTERSADTQQRFARLVASLSRKHGLRPLDPAGVARLIEHSSRLAGDAQRMDLGIGDLTDLLRESDYEAIKAAVPIVTGAEVQRAIDARTFRADRIRERMREGILRNTIFVDTDGHAAGQVNGLSVLQLGRFEFGQPVRITARVRPGKGEIIDIEREVELGGPLHSKGVLILSAFLGSRYAPDFPLALSAALVFEQSYSGVEGDSASSAELYALLSAISGIPIRQSLAVTGSVNQHGQVQPIGGVNEKIEGFFDICARRGLTGSQGVLIPSANVKNLMLRHDVVEAVRSGVFHVYSVDTIDQGIEILTGVPHGVRDAAGAYAPGTIGALVQGQLREMAEKQIGFTRALQGGPGGNPS